MPWEEPSKETGGKYTELAAKLHCDMDLWDNFQSPLEELPWNSLYKDIRMGGVATRYVQNSWDCCVSTIIVVTISTNWRVQKTSKFTDCVQNTGMDG